MIWLIVTLNKDWMNGAPIAAGIVLRTVGIANNKQELYIRHNVPVDICFLRDTNFKNQTARGRLGFAGVVSVERK